MDKCIIQAIVKNTLTPADHGNIEGNQYQPSIYGHDIVSWQ